MVLYHSIITPLWELENKVSFKVLGCCSSLVIEMLLVKMEHFKNNHRCEEILSGMLVMFGGMVLGPVAG